LRRRRPDARVAVVAYAVDADGKGEVLWPSNEEPAPKVAAGGRAVLPSPAEEAEEVTAGRGAATSDLVLG
jgi:hypothetical protein